MSLGDFDPNEAKPSTPPSSDKTAEYLAEVASYTPTKAMRYVYERQILDLAKTRDHLANELSATREQFVRELTTIREQAESKIATLQQELRDAGAYRVAHARLKRGKVETFIQLVFITALTGFGGLGMGVFPRAATGASPPEFYVSCAMVAMGVLLGAVVKPATLIACYVFPKLCADKKPD